MMEAARTSETLVNFYQTTRCYNPEDSNLQQLNSPDSFFVKITKPNFTQNSQVSFGNKTCSQTVDTTFLLTFTACAMCKKSKTRAIHKQAEIRFSFLCKRYRQSPELHRHLTSVHKIPSVQPIKISLIHQELYNIHIQ
jgi:hypothetical protein